VQNQKNKKKKKKKLLKKQKKIKKKKKKPPTKPQTMQIKHTNWECPKWVFLFILG